jgi:excisionase family DNA binding protein
MSEIFFNTNDVAQMLQVDKSTVKRWADEGKIKCFRTPGGHRKFSSDDVYGFMSSFHYGVSAAQPASQGDSDETIIKKIVEKKEFNVLASVCFNSAIKGKKDEALALFFEVYRAGVDLPSIFENILRPTLKRIRDTFIARKISPIELQMANNVLTSSVVQFGDMIRRQPKNNRSIILVSTDVDKNDVEMNALSTLFEVQGFSVMNVGTGVNVDSVNQLIHRTKPYAVCLCVRATENSDDLVKEIETVLHTTNDNMTRLIVGGGKKESEILKENFIGIQVCSSFVDFTVAAYQETEENIKQ